MAAPGAHPVISGAVRVTGWTLDEPAGTLWSAPAPAGLLTTRALFVNGIPARRTHVRLQQPDPGSDATPILPVTSRNPGLIEFVDAGSSPLWSDRAGVPPFFADNVFEGLGRPGEWYFDPTAKARLYYTAAAAAKVIWPRPTSRRAVASGAGIEGNRHRRQPAGDRARLQGHPVRVHDPGSFVTRRALGRCAFPVRGIRPVPRGRLPPSRERRTQAGRFLPGRTDRGLLLRGRRRTGALRNLGEAGPCDEQPIFLCLDGGAPERSDRGHPVRRRRHRLLPARPLSQERPSSLDRSGPVHDEMELGGQPLVPP